MYNTASKLFLIAGLLTIFTTPSFSSNSCSNSLSASKKNSIESVKKRFNPHGLPIGKVEVVHKKALFEFSRFNENQKLLKAFVKNNETSFGNDTVEKVLNTYNYDTAQFSSFIQFVSIKFKSSKPARRTKNSQGLYILKSIVGSADTWFDLVSPKVLSDFAEAYYNNIAGLSTEDLNLYMPVLLRHTSYLLGALGAEHPLVVALTNWLSERRVSVIYSKFFNQFPASAQKILNMRWLIPKNINGITIDNIGHSNKRDEVESCGTCQLMAHYHFDSILNGGNHIITWNGHIIGSLKKRGNKSFFALENVYDHKGRLILVKGGVYKPSKVLIRRLSGKVVDLAELSSTDPSVIKFMPMMMMKMPYDLRISAKFGIHKNMHQDDYAGEALVRSVDIARSILSEKIVSERVR